MAHVEEWLLSKSGAGFPLWMIRYSDDLHCIYSEVWRVLSGVETSKPTSTLYRLSWHLLGEIYLFKLKDI